MRTLKICSTLVLAAIVAGCDRPSGKGRDEQPQAVGTKGSPGSGPCTQADFVLIPKGSFVDNWKRPPQTVTVPYDFLIFQSEATQLQYAKFAALIRKDVPEVPDELKGDQRPQVYVSNYDASEFCGWVGEQLQAEPWIAGALKAEEWEARLPYGFEWERAGRGEDGKHEYATKTGKFTDQGIVYAENSNLTTADVGSKAGHYVTWGGKEVYDLSGNVWEWVEETATLGPPFRDSLRVLRGGCYASGWHWSQREHLSVSLANHVDVDSASGAFGFRCVIVPKIPAW